MIAFLLLTLAVAANAQQQTCCQSNEYSQRLRQRLSFVVHNRATSLEQEGVYSYSWVAKKAAWNGTSKPSSGTGNRQTTLIIWDYGDKKVYTANVNQQSCHVRTFSDTMMKCIPSTAVRLGSFAVGNSKMNTVGYRYNYTQDGVTAAIEAYMTPGTDGCHLLAESLIQRPHEATQMIAGIGQTPDPLLSTAFLVPNYCNSSAVHRSDKIYDPDFRPIHSFR